MSSIDQARQTIAYADFRRADEREECVKVAERVGKELGEPAIGYAIAQAIRSGASE